MSVPSIDEFAASERAPAELEILSSGHEDLYGLWELAGAADSVVPETHPAHALRLVQAIVLDLVNRGLLELRHGHALEDEENSEIVAPEQREAVIGELANWDPYARAEADPYYTVTGTPAGIEEYYRQGYAAAGEEPPAPPAER